MDKSDPQGDDTALPAASHGAVIRFPARPGSGPASQASAIDRVSFSRIELSALLDLYGRHVAAGTWRDYAIDFLHDRAIFSIYRRTSDAPSYRIEKRPRLERRHGTWSVTGQDGRVLKRGNDLSRVLAIIDKPFRMVRG